MLGVQRPHLSVHTVNNLWLFNYYWHVYQCYWGPYVILAFLPNMLYSWNKLILIIIILFHITRTSAALIRLETRSPIFFSVIFPPPAFSVFLTFLPCRTVPVLPKVAMVPMESVILLHYYGLEIIMHFSCFLDPSANLLIRHMVFLRNNQTSSIASHLSAWKVYEPQHDKTNKMTCAQLRLRSAWSESSLCAQMVAKDSSFLYEDTEDSEAQSDMSLRLAHMPFRWFYNVAAQWTCKYQEPVK